MGAKLQAWYTPRYIKNWQRLFLCALPPESGQWFKGRFGRPAVRGRRSGFGVEQPLEGQLPSAGDSQAMVAEDLGGVFILRSPAATTFQPKLAALKPASIQEVTSRTLARHTDKNGEQRGHGRPKTRNREGCRS